MPRQFRRAFLTLALLAVQGCDPCRRCEEGQYCWIFSSDVAGGDSRQCSDFPAECANDETCTCLSEFGDPFETCDEDEEIVTVVVIGG